ncbi:MAG: aminopeptidase P family protein [Verrucomicrobia bacterium]|nr:aminopeptidase P family protein [Verrucomicrobiota bacterium]
MKRPSLLIIADSENDADMRYAVGMAVPERFIFLNTEGRTIALLPDAELARGKAQSQVNRVAALSRYLRRAELDGIKCPSLAHAAARLCEEYKVRKLTVPYLFPVGLARQLRKLGLRIKVRDGNFFPERQYKSPAEVKMITAALGMAEVGMSEGIHALKRAKIGSDRKLQLHGVPLTSEKLRAIIETAVMQAGGTALHTIVAGGVQGCDPHELGHGPLFAHSPVVIGIRPRSTRTGYHGRLSRTLVRGRASDAVRRQFLTVLKAQAIAFTMLREGTQANEVHAGVERYFRSEGYRTHRQQGRPIGFFHATGHGIGLEANEGPRAQRGSTTTLRAGHVVSLQPGLYYPEVGGVRLEDVALITGGEPQNLTQFEKVLEV